MIKLRILESKSLSNSSKNVFGAISKELVRLGFNTDLDSFDVIGSVDILNIVASNDQGEFISMQIMVDTNSDFKPYSVVFKHSMRYGRKEKFDSVDKMIGYIVKVASESEIRTSYDTKTIKQRKQLLCQDCIDTLRGISGKRVTVLKDADIPKRRIFISDSSYTSGEEVCKCDRCKNVYPVDWIHVCTIN